MLTLYQFVAGLLLFTHWLACTFKLLRDIQLEGSCAAFDDVDQPDDSIWPCTWLELYQKGKHKNNDTSALYMLCLYWVGTHAHSVCVGLQASQPASLGVLHLECLTRSL